MSIVKNYLSATQSLGKAQMMIGFYISIILAIILFIAIIVIYMNKKNWVKTTANVTSISCDINQNLEQNNNTTNTTNNIISKYSIEWELNNKKYNNNLSKMTKQCVQCTNSLDCNQTIDIIYNPKEPSNVSFVSNKKILIFILTIIIIICIISAIINYFGRNNKIMQTASGVNTELSIFKKLF